MTSTFFPQTIDLSASAIQQIRTALANPKVTFDKTGLKSYDASGNLVSAINSDGSAQLTGVITAEGLTVPSTGIVQDYPPQASNSVMWARQSDGSVVAEIYSYNVPGGPPAAGEVLTMESIVEPGDQGSTVLQTIDQQLVNARSFTRLAANFYPGGGANQNITASILNRGGTNVSRTLHLLDEQGNSDTVRLTAPGAALLQYSTGATPTLNWTTNPIGPGTTNLTMAQLGGVNFPNSVDAIVCNIIPGPGWPTYYAARANGSGVTIELALSGSGSGSSAFIVNWIAIGH